MAREKTWAAIGPLALTGPGTTDGKIPVSNAIGLKAKMRIRLTDPFLPNLDLEIKRVPSPTIIEVGPVGAPITSRTNVSAYGIGSFVYAPEQPRNFNIPLQEIQRQTYEEEPTVAWRVMMTDPFGQFYTSTNPFPVKIYPGVPEQIISSYNEVAAVASSVLTTVHTYTVPALKTAVLEKIDVNGDNIANYSVLINGVIQDRKRTYFSGPLNEVFLFSDSRDNGIPLNSGDIVQIKVIHGRPVVGQFGARIQVLQIG